MIDKKYIPVIKTGESELKAIKNLTAELKSFILPLFELTKARKKPKEILLEILLLIDSLSSFLVIL